MNKYVNIVTIFSRNKEMTEALTLMHSFLGVPQGKSITEEIFFILTPYFKVDVHFPAAQMDGNAIPYIALASLLVGSQADVVGGDHGGASKVPKRSPARASVMIRLRQAVLAFLVILCIPTVTVFR